MSPDYPPWGDIKTHVLCKITISIFTPVDKSLLILNGRLIVCDASQTYSEFDLETFNLLTRETERS